MKPPADRTADRATPLQAEVRGGPTGHRKQGPRAPPTPRPLPQDSPVPRTQVAARARPRRNSGLAARHWGAAWSDSRQTSRPRRGANRTVSRRTHFERKCGHRTSARLPSPGPFPQHRPPPPTVHQLRERSPASKPRSCARPARHRTGKSEQLGLLGTRALDPVLDKAAPG